MKEEVLNTIKNNSNKQLILSGLILALAALTRPQLMPLLPILLFIIFINNRTQYKLLLRKLLICCLFATLGGNAIYFDFIGILVKKLLFICLLFQNRALLLLTSPA